ncbi:MAG: hypothetical protein JWM11_1342 [Planctomycetaceae bacterium]|nr:hypothetical protein [Planctomycetaceae bacterium]
MSVTLGHSHQVQLQPSGPFEKSIVQNTIQQELKGVITFIAIIWVVFLLEFVMPFNLLSYGVTPRTLSGLWGIPVMPFLHANLQHIVSNTIPLFVLLVLLAGSKARSWEVVAEIVVFGGLLLWLCGRPATHVGASGLIFGLIAFLIVSGWMERRFVPLVIAVVVTFLYGGILLPGVMPHIGSHISWDGHLFGAIAGGIIAYLTTNTSSLLGVSRRGEKITMTQV